MNYSSPYFVINPIVLIIYNRPDTTAEVIKIIEKIHPKEIYVIADGPKANDSHDVERCKATRDLIDNMQVDCEIYKNYSDFNMGGPKRIPSGIDWVFSKVEQAIILEHDCVPSISFFQFCDDLLEYYKSDDRIGMISGNNFLKEPVSYYSYYFSNFANVWGWATWKRAWNHFDISIDVWGELKERDFLNNLFDTKIFRKYFEKIIKNQYSNTKRHWDYAWRFNCWSQNMLTVSPNKNLVSNIGFDLKATNTKDKYIWYAYLPDETIKFPLQHPPYVCRDYLADLYTQKYRFHPGSLHYRVFKKIRFLLYKFISARKAKIHDREKI